MNLPAPLPLTEAQAKLLALADRLPVVELPIAETLGRYLARPLISQRTQPPSDLSAMDGYAMRSGDTSGPWKIVGESAAGHPFSGEIANGEAVRISTGALLPAKAGAILLQEEAAREGQALSTAAGGLATARHIRRAGFDFQEGDALLPRGALMGAPQIALALSAGHMKFAVHQRPRVTIIDTGDELAADAGNCAPHQIPASNGAMIAAMISQIADNIRHIGPVPDDLEKLATALNHAEDADIIVTSGGASVGDHDLLQPALEKAGFKLSFWRVAMKPGKPLMIARKGKQILLGLPGNPVSSYVTAYFFLLPLLRAMAGATSPLPQSQIMRLARNIPAGGKRLEFLRGRYVGDGVEPVDAMQDSSGLMALSQSNALIERPALAKKAEIGEMVAVFPLNSAGMA
ncbi:molybdopterin molybdenumtransferase MoeA [Altererythrobacter indicus]|uniref:Molybdopterin molybdenumtransferase n=1 Tax=Altericroceibacterium indicum TaxID=374177 RepID=A0A845A9R6_9SPHN|nr:molybdopterin molybdotransferase MoeA [Altericroceibacterium indicum]MXP25286.1 molybdopterin molybdenumtransferase MoeA [Altericroceibacterium indicum]